MKMYFPNRLTGIKRNNPEEAITAPAKIRMKKDDTISLLACQRDTGMQCLYTINYSSLNQKETSAGNY